MPASVKITGGRETARALKTLGRYSSQTKVLRQSLRPGARLMVKLARQGAPRGATGALRKSIAVGVVKTRNGQAKLMVGHRRDDPHSRWRVSHIVEFGSRYVSARPYMTPAANAGARPAIKAFGGAVWPLIAREATRIASRSSRRRRR